MFYIDPTKGLEKLADLLNLDNPPRCIEGIDIANLMGSETVGSLVCFIDGKPFKTGYRRFKIKTVEGSDDYASIREVVSRRYRHAADGDELYPDVILIDGGLGQLHAARDAFNEMNVQPPMVISLAKRMEEIYIQARSVPVRFASARRTAPAFSVAGPALTSGGALTRRATRSASTSAGSLGRLTRPARCGPWPAPFCWRV